MRISKLCPSDLTSNLVCIKLSLVLAVILSCGCESESSLRYSKYSKYAGGTKVETADEYIKVLDGSDFKIDYRLPEKEEQLLIDQLQSRHEFKSLRDRLGNSPVADFDVDDNQHYPFSNSRRRALMRLHSQHVTDFVAQDGFGVGRGGTPLNSGDLKLFENLAIRLDKREVGSDYFDDRGLAPDTAANKRLFDQLDVFNKQAAKRFAEEPALGYVKNVDEVAGFDEHRFRQQKGWGGSIFDIYAARPSNREVDWIVNEVQLIGLLMHDEPVAYVSENLPDMEELSSATVQTRGLTPFELEALEKFKGGDDTHVNATLNRVEMVGALRASNACVQCHAVENGTLLGAFSYEVLRHPSITPEPGQDDSSDPVKP